MDVLVPIVAVAFAAAMFWWRRRRGAGACPRCEAGDPCDRRAPE